MTAIVTAPPAIADALLAHLPRYEVVSTSKARNAPAVALRCMHVVGDDRWSPSCLD